MNLYNSTRQRTRIHILTFPLTLVNLWGGGRRRGRGRTQKKQRKNKHVTKSWWHGIVKAKENEKEEVERKQKEKEINDHDHCPLCFDFQVRSSGRVTGLTFPLHHHLVLAGGDVEEFVLGDTDVWVHRHHGGRPLVHHVFGVVPVWWKGNNVRGRKRVECRGELKQDYRWM